VNNLVTIALFSDPIEANLQRSLLEAKGITCFLADENLISIIPLYSLAVGSIKLKVPESEVKEAMEVLKKDSPVFADNFQLKDKPAGKFHCPNCCSENIYKKYLSGRNLPWFLFFGLPRLLANKKYHCFDCGYEWNNKKG
jgi:predicted RNA-binding Zn-ribbon protein involved in translation (DUF1610 family)